MNRQVNDAWGVRDIMGAGVMLSSAYNPEMTKPRTYEFRVFPPEKSLLQVRRTVSGVDATVNALFTPSASRFVDYYVSGGLRRQYEPVEKSVTIDTEDGPRDITILEPPQWNFVTEIGFKLRARIPSKARWAVLGYQFGGVRVGVQALGFGSLDDLRLIFEIGAGAW